MSIFKNKRRWVKGLGVALAVGVIATAVAAISGSANASIPSPVKGNATVLQAAPRIVGSPGMHLNAGQTVSLAVAGESFGGIEIPENATGVAVTVTTIAPAGDGQLKVWTTEAGEPGTGAVQFKTGVQTTEGVFVGLNSDGKLNVKATGNATSFVMALNVYYTPVPTVPAAVHAEIAPNAATLAHVGGSIYNGATLLGTLANPLPAGTYDARMLAGWTGLNTTTGGCVPADGSFLTGTVVMTLDGPTVDPDGAGPLTAHTAFDEGQVVGKAGGVMIPKSNSATLTQDPTAMISTHFTIAVPTKVNIFSFAYLSNSGSTCDGHVSANLASATFDRVN